VPGSRIGVTAGYGLDDRGLNRWGSGGGGAQFSASVLIALEPIQRSVQKEETFFAGLKRLGGDIDHPRPSRAEVKEKVELLFYSPSVPSLFVLRRTLPHKV
jgi:hypothetical protein